MCGGGSGDVEGGRAKRRDMATHQPAYLREYLERDNIGWKVIVRGKASPRGSSGEVMLGLGSDTSFPLPFTSFLKCFGQCTFPPSPSFTHN